MNLTLDSIIWNESVNKFLFPPPLPLAQWIVFGGIAISKYFLDATYPRSFSSSNSSAISANSFSVSATEKPTASTKPNRAKITDVFILSSPLELEFSTVGIPKAHCFYESILGDIKICFVPILISFDIWSWNVNPRESVKNRLKNTLVGLKDINLSFNDFIRYAI